MANVGTAGAVLEMREAQAAAHTLGLEVATLESFLVIQDAACPLGIPVSRRSALIQGPEATETFHSRHLEWELDWLLERRRIGPLLGTRVLIEHRHPERR